MMNNQPTDSNGGGINNDSKRLLITHVDAFGPYLRISGQLNPDAIQLVRTKMQQVLPTCFAIDPNWPVTRQQPLLLTGALCLYKRINGAAPADCEFVRARILSSSVVQQTPQQQSSLLQVEVECIDYGHTALVASYELLFPQQNELLQNIPTLCSQYIMLGVCTDWKKSELDEILRMITHQTLDISIQMEFNQFKFITMKWKEFNFAEFLIHQKKIGAPISNDLLRDNFLKILKQQQYFASAGPLITSKNNNNYNYNSNTNNNNNGGSAEYSSGGGGANQAREQLAARRSLQARLQQQQQQQQPMHMQNVVMHPIQPRMPHTIGNLRSMMQGIHVQNNRIPYTGPKFHQAPQMAPIVYNGANVMPAPQQLAAATSIPNAYTARYQRPQPPQPLGGVTNPTNNSAVTSPPRRTTTATFKSSSLVVGTTYDVCVSFVENGPCLFSVQLASAQNDLTEMMNQIERVQLKQFTEKPVLGTACIARYSEDGQLYRALITGVQPTACKVAYIDYGNAELVNFRDLYEIPDEFLSAKAFAIRFTLSGHKELEPIDESLKKAFKDLVIYKNCKLQVMPLEGPPLVQYCELYMQDKSILDVLKQIQKCRLVYAKAIPLQNNDIVEIRYIDSPKHFYVQKVVNIAEFEQLMDDMFLYYNKNQLVPNHLALGAPCIVKYENEWYRAEVMRADATAIIVRHVDFGYEQKVTKNLLSTIAEAHLKLPRQAVQCCLKGFENNELSKDLATTQFEMLAEESNRKRRSFTVKVFRIQPDGVNLVNLCTKDLNVMKKLYKLSMPFEQYLTLEKEEFNLHSHNGHHNNKNNGENSHKTPSIASSNDVASSVHSSSKKSNVNMLNSTLLSKDERIPSHQQQQQQPFVQKNTLQQQQQQQQQQPRIVSHNTSAASLSTTEWDKQSSAASSVDNRDSRSSSSEHKQGKQRQQQRQHGGRNNNLQQNMLNMSVGSSNSDRRSNGSGGSANYNNNRRSGGSNSGGNNMSPRFQNLKPDHDNRRHNKQQQIPTPPQNQRAQRPQNGPQGYSQQRQKPANSNRTNDASSSGACTSDEHESQIEEYLPLERAFPNQPIETPAREEVNICWWISPHQFYTQVKSRVVELERLMQAMQKFYKTKPLQPLQLRVGSHVIARYRRDNILYRARLLAVNHMLRKYKVKFVDFGNEYTVTSEDIWPVEKRFGDLPCMAYLCSFHGVVSNSDHLYLIDRMEQYLPKGATLICEYIERDSKDMYFVNVNQNNVSLKQTLKDEGFITEVCPEFRLDLLVGQQIRAKISSIKDMLNFKIQIEGCDDHIQLLCSYDDLRYVKSNPDIAQKFKQFYEGKSCVVNIRDVNDNKVILLRPLLPLLKDDIPTYICTYPIILETFAVRIVYVASAYRVFAQLLSTEMKVATLLDDMYAHYQKEGTSLNNFEYGQICAAKGSDGNWYRARIVASGVHAKNTTVEVYYIDYGNTEKLEKTKIKRLDEKFYTNQSAYAIEMNLPLRMLNQTGDQQLKQQAATVIKKLKELTLEQVLNAKALMVRRNHLIADIYLNNATQKSVIDELKEQQLIKGRDVEHMRKLLDKEKPNMHEYMEMVDLTLEDEDETEKKPMAKAKPLTPKKKKIEKPIEKQFEPVAKVEKLAEPALEIIQQPAEVVNNVAPTKTVEIPQAEPTEIIIKPAAAIIAEPEILPVTTAVVPKEPEPEPVIVVDPYAHMETATLSHCDNPAQFFVNPSDKLDKLHQLQDNLQIVASSLPPLMNVCNGAHCISLYSVDKQWYRAQIMDAELMVLKFIDFGNTDCVTDATDIKEMSVFPDIEPFCLPFALPIKPNGTADWVDAANAIFNDSYTKVLHYEYIVRGDLHKRSFINLFIEGVNIAERLIADGYAKPLEVVISGANCFISHVNNISDFYLQYEKDSKALELIEMYLAESFKLPALERFERSKIVAALFPDDGMWYRARLLRELPNDGGYEVLFIDYGNTSVSPECREISDEIASWPTLSKKCALELPPHCLAWSDAAEEKFAEIAAIGETIFTVILREPAAQHAIVHLLIDGQNVNADLEPLCTPKPVSELEVLNTSFANTSIHTSSVYESGELHDAIISHANSPCDFYLQTNKDSVRLEDMTASLNSLGMDALQQPELGQLCAAVFCDDGTLYRARVDKIIPGDTCEFHVLFIDYGNEAIATDLRVLPQDLLQLKAFSRRCQLENSPRFSQFGAVATETFNTLIDACEGLVKVDILDGDVNPAIVKLYAANTDENMCEKLNKLLGLNATIDVAVAVSSPNGPAALSSVPAPAPNTCLISHAISPMHFYIQPASNSTKMDFVTQTLKHAEDYPLLTTVEVGIVCSVYSAEDDCYYRGRVERILADASYEIFLLDYGNTIVAQKLRELSMQQRAIPALALRCQLDTPPPQNCNDSALLAEHFVALVDSHFGEFYEIDADVLDSETRAHAVRLQINYKDLAEELAAAIARGAVAHVDTPLEPVLHQCCVIHVNSPSSFYIQLAADVVAVEKITDVLLDAETEFQAFDAPLKVGDLCAAQFPEDLAFYRAQIVRVVDTANGQYEVHYLDFGNNSLTDQFRKLPDNMLNMPGYSKHCTLDGQFASAEASTHFQTLIDSRFSETFQVEFLKTTVDPQICRLFYQDRNVATELTQLLKEGDVNIQTEGDSWIESNKNLHTINPSSGVSSMIEDDVDSAANGVPH